MKVLLIHPKFSYRGKDLFPLGLGYLAGIAEGHNISVIDENITPFDITKIKNDLDIIGISSTTPSFSRAMEIVKEIKEFRCDLIIVMGGTHVTFSPEEALKGGVDIIVTGEGEYSFLEILEGKEIDKIKGLVYMNKNKIIKTLNRELIHDLDSVPFPAWNYFPINKYGIMSLITSRGCPYSCAYCSAAKFWKNQVRYRSPENVIDELNLISDLGFKLIRFMDSTFTLEKKHCLKICELIKEERLDLKWSCETRADAIDKDILKSFAKSGCNLICIGIDTGSQQILDGINRRIRASTIANAFDKIRKYGISTRAYVTFGFPGEQEKSVVETLNFLKKVNPDQILLSLATAYPGNKFWGENFVEIHPDWVSKFQGHGLGGKLYLANSLSRKDYIKLADFMWNEVRRISKGKPQLIN
jgi:radical SAM superfamily enzyme YgiQ (UPF0313 family)|tara:strand:+ start:409 stop:1650 length:1242 start_codon:yes stop_codon:yes gene_type:complete